MTTTPIEELRQRVREEQERPLPDIVKTGSGQQGTNLVEDLTVAFNRIILPSWGLFILLESGIVSFLIGLELYFDSPLILIFGGLVQILPVSAIILKRVHGAKKFVAKEKAKNSG